jgi:hypothetical protein
MTINECRISVGKYGTRMHKWEDDMKFSLKNMFMNMSTELKPGIRETTATYNYSSQKYISLRSILIIFSHLRICLPNAHFQNFFLAKI